jgi:DNA-binding IclR family transcriptional regulator
VPRSSSSAVDKALDVVEAVARSDRPLRLSEVADAVGLHRATAYRVLLDLVRRGWVLRTGEHYLPGTAVLQLSRGAAANSLAILCRPALAALAEQTAMMVNLQVLGADRSLVIDVVRPDRLAMISDLRGELLPIHRFAGPLALVAALDDDARAPYLAPAQADGYPLTSLLADLDQVRASGFAVEHGRHDAVIASISRAVSLSDGAPACAVTIVAPSAEFTEARLDELRQHLAAATDRIRAALAVPAPITPRSSP